MNAKELGTQPAHPHNSRNTGIWLGLTKRELFAAMAMQGILSDPAIGNGNIDKAKFRAQLAEGAVDIADYLLAELAKDKP